MRALAGAVALSALALLSGCGRADDSKSTAPGAASDPLGHEYALGTADPCELLRAADPGALLGTELGPELRIYGLCRYAARVRVPTDPERAIGLELRREPARAVPTSLDEFWAREGNGVDLMGGKRDAIVELDGLGSYALWYPSRGGLQLHAYWDAHDVLVLTIAGAPVERALPWAQELARKAIAKASTPVSSAGAR